MNSQLPADEPTSRRALRPFDAALVVRVRIALAAQRVAALSVGARRIAITESTVVQADFADALEARAVAARLGARLRVPLAPCGRRRHSAVLLEPRRAIGATRFAAATADRRHVLAVAADGHAALAARGARLARVELVRRALLVRGTTTLAGDLTLLLTIHGCEAAV